MELSLLNTQFGKQNIFNNLLYPSTSCIKTEHRRRTVTRESKSVHPVSGPVGKGQLSCSGQIV